MRENADFEGIQPMRADYYPILGQLMAELDLAGTINRLVGPVDSQTKIDVGTYVALFIHHMLGDVNIKLYHMDDFFQDKAIPLLVPWNPGVDLSDMNDDRAARVLDAIWKANAQHVFSAVASSAIRVHSLETGSVHTDTTSISFEGAYDDEPEDGSAPRVDFGFSKDHRPDLKQLIFGVGTTADGIPIIAEIANGNESDMALNGRWIKNLRRMMQKTENDELLCIADSSLVTTENLKLRDTARINIISRLPGRFGIEADLKRRAVEANRWDPVGCLSTEKGSASYKVWETSDDIDGNTYRFVIVHSDHKDTRKQKKLGRDIAKESEKQTKRLVKLAKRRFACREDAVVELTKQFITRPLHYHDVIWDVQERLETVKRAQRGRPRKGDVPPMRTSYYALGRLNVKEDAVTSESERGGLFVLITTLDDATKYPAKKILELYKGQGNVERVFRFIKNPAWVGAFCIKKEERLAAFGYVLLMAAMVYTLWERRVRRALTPKDVNPIEGLNRQKTKKPTSYALQTVLSAILVQSRVRDGTMTIWLPKRLRPNQVRVIELSGFNVGIYEGQWRGGKKIDGAR